MNGLMDENFVESMMSVASTIPDWPCGSAVSIGPNQGLERCPAELIEERIRTLFEP
jgi:hypothetical protein